MSRTVTAFFDNRSDAEQARSRLSAASIDSDRVRIIDQAHVGNGSGGQERGLWSSIKSAFMPDEDGHAYEEGLRRGGYLLCAEVDEAEADRAIALLDQGGSVDFDQRQDQWRSQGWSGSTEAAIGADYARGSTVEEEHIPLVEEELRIGKREVARGGARVRSYVRETPVHEQVNLREEHVSVERRAVDQPLARGQLDRDSDLLRERTVEMTEHAEEAVIDKEARVREELVLKKTAEEHSESVDETVRHTEVDVDTGRSADERSAFGGFSNRQNDGDHSRRGDDELGREREGASYGSNLDRGTL